MKRAGIFLALLIAAGCGGTKVLVAPRIDLRPYEVIGMIPFESSSKGPLAQLATVKFKEALRADQGVVRILDLGTEAELLTAVGGQRLDRETLRAIGKKYDVRTVIRGSLIVSDVRPGVSLVPGLKFASISAEVDATLQADLIETSTGASLWNKEVSQTHKLGEVSFFGGKNVSFDARDPERAYGAMVGDLVYALTPDFRARWERRND